MRRGVSQRRANLHADARLLTPFFPPKIRYAKVLTPATRGVAGAIATPAKDSAPVKALAKLNTQAGSSTRTTHNSTTQKWHPPHDTTHPCTYNLKRILQQENVAKQIAAHFIAQPGLNSQRDVAIRNIWHIRICVSDSVALGLNKHVRSPIW